MQNGRGLPPKLIGPTMSKSDCGEKKKQFISLRNITVSTLQ